MEGIDEIKVSLPETHKAIADQQNEHMGPTLIALFVPCVETVVKYQVSLRSELDDGLSFNINALHAYVELESQGSAELKEMLARGNGMTPPILYAQFDTDTRTESCAHIGSRASRVAAASAGHGSTLKRPSVSRGDCFKRASPQASKDGVLCSSVPPHLASALLNRDHVVGPLRHT